MKFIHLSGLNRGFFKSVKFMAAIILTSFNIAEMRNENDNLDLLNPRNN